MRAGQPCLAHSVGGLTDTIIHNNNGFTFNGDSALQQAENMLSCFDVAIKVKKLNPIKWDKIAENAMKARFLWQNAALDYIKNLYSN
jgi:starch synthase